MKKPEAHMNLAAQPFEARRPDSLARLRGAGGNTGVAQRVTFRGNGGLPINPTSPGYIHSAEVESATVY